MGGYKEIIDLVRDGEAVKAAITNRPTGQVDANVRYLRTLFESAMLGEAVFARSRTVEVDAKVGQAVYYNPATQQFERGLGNVTVNDQGMLETAATSQVWGLVYVKTTSTKADILLHGTGSFDLSEAVDGTPTPGEQLYLSNVQAGKLQAVQPPVGVRVGQVGVDNADGTFEVFVNTRFQDLLEAHKHYKFNLQAVPAGDHTQPTPGDIHLITNPSTNIEGWLPAGHAVFAGNAPVGAAFGYNIGAGQVGNVWPPLPVEHSVLEMSRTNLTTPTVEGLITVPDNLVVIDRNGIWWMSDCYDQVPWPTDYDASSSVSSSLSCPVEIDMSLVLWFIKPIFQNTSTAVLSLRAAENSGLSVTCTDTGEDAVTGHLKIDQDLSLLLDGEDEAGCLVMKDLASDGTIQRGNVVESLKAGSSNVTLTSAITTDAGESQCNVVIAVDQDLEGREVDVDSVRLDGCEEEYYASTIGIGFSESRDSTYRGRINIPAGLDVPSGTKLKLRFWILNRANLTVPQDILSFTYRVAAQPSAVLTPLDLPLDVAESVAETLPASDVTVTAANQYFTVETTAFDITAGDIVHFSLTRAAGDGYAGNLHMLRQRGVYVEPTT